MNYVTFKIAETKGGDFVLFLHNYHQKLISEKFRSKNILMVKMSGFQKGGKEPLNFTVVTARSSMIQHAKKAGKLKHCSRIKVRSGSGKTELR